MEIACCQLDIVWEDKPANFAKVAAMARASELSPGALLVLPEMFATGYSMNAGQVAEPADGATGAFLSELAARHRVFVLAGVALRGDAGRSANEALAFDPLGRPLARYAKMFPFSAAKENVHYAAGADVACFDWAGCRVAPAVCYDLRFPELFRRQAQRGAEVLAIIANWPVARADHWITLLKARAIENQAYVVGVNRCGSDPWLAYPGRSQIIDPHGRVLADAGADERVIRAAIDVNVVRDWRRDFPALRDVRADLCGPGGG